MIHLKPVDIELIGQMNPYLGLGLEMITSFILGALVGLDRENKLKSAGLKTNILICLGSTLYTAVSLLIYEGGVNDPNRTAAQIVSGVGFLGAGAIMHGKGSVSGLTTAATIWMVAAVGMTVGAGYPIIATLFTLTVLFVLRILDPIYKAMNFARCFHLEIYSDRSYIDLIKGHFSRKSAEILDIWDVKLEKEVITKANIQINTKEFKFMVDLLRQDKKIKKVIHNHIDSEEAQNGDYFST